MESFSKKIKNSLISAQIKKKCCLRMFDLGRRYDGSTKLRDALSMCKCPSCASHFSAGLFVSCGSVTDPEKRYHLDLKFKSGEEAVSALDFFGECGLSPKMGKRRDDHIVYFKESGAIEDFLAYIGANAAAFDFMNSKIMRELRSNANRVVNCDTANIRKTLAASQRSLDIINEIIDGGFIDQLPPELKETALLRIKYDQLTLGELGERHEKPITKSGVKHRLEKIAAFYESLSENKG